MARGYRFGVVGNLSTVPNGKTVLPTDDIQIWLKCASIKDKTYTTLAQVLADSTTLQTLISSNNAVDYMVRSTTWASGVTADSGAMTLIGANNYASNTLLDDSTWLNAICNSTYFESVLNVKVPTMTSNTTPSGEVIANAQYSSKSIWKAFDGNDTTDGAYTGVINGYIGYHFTDNVSIYKAIIYPQADMTGETFYIQESSDGTNYSDISSALNSLSIKSNTVLCTPSNTKKAYCRITNTTRNKTYSGYSFYAIQFYGRKDV